MNTNEPRKYDGERLKLHEAIGATMLVAFAAGAIVFSFAFLATQRIAIDAIDHIWKKRS